MPTPREQAAADLNAKLRLEAMLRRELRPIDAKLARAVAVSVASTGEVGNVEAASAEALEPVLRDHYDRVEQAFAGRISRQLPADRQATNEEEVAIAAALALFFNRKAASEAAKLARTNAADASFAARLGRELGEAADGARDLGATVGRIFQRKLEGRQAARVCFATQFSAEATKLTEAEVLVGATPTVADEAPNAPAAAASVATLRIERTWFNKGDDRVRGKHRPPDGQVRLVGIPFDVAGDVLMYPGDSSLGAAADNVLGCRCSAVFNTAAISAARG